MIGFVFIDSGNGGGGEDSRRSGAPDEQGREPEQLGTTNVTFASSSFYLFATQKMSV